MYVLHPIQRAKERYGLDLTIDNLNQMVSMIHSGAAVLMGSCHDRGSKTYLLKWEGVTVLVVYSPQSDQVITFSAAGSALPRGHHGVRKSGKMAKRGRLKRRK